MIALSTSWLPENGWSVERALDALEPFGVRAVEFNYRLHPLNVTAARQELARRGLTVISLHNVCASNGVLLTDDDHYGDSIASLDETLREVGTTRLRQTAEVARRLGAQAVVVHGGRVAVSRESLIYKAAYKQARHENNPDIIREQLPELLAERSTTAPQHVSQLIRSLKEVCPSYPDVKFGLETRYDFHGLPDFDEMAQVLNEVGCDNVGYWHDCGHGQFRETLGLSRHEDWLKRYQELLIGVHLHGMRNRILDHAGPTPDNMDFAMIRRYTRPDTILVMELNSATPAEAVRLGKEYLETVFEN